MASQSPAEGEESNAYVQGWIDLVRELDSGSSWSGHERNCAYQNLDGGSFVDVSAVSGLDFVDDARAVVATDWDGDGDLDLWLKNRTAPQLRYLENRSADARTVTLELEGRTCNRDAIGARVEVRLGGRKLVREVRAGDGYLSQSSTRLVFGVGSATEIEGATVHWPGGDTQEVTGLEPGGRYRVVQGVADAGSLPSRRVELAALDATWGEPERSERVVLRTPLPLPPQLAARLFSEPGRARLVNLWGSWCAPCLGELSELARVSDVLHAEGVDVLPVIVDPPEDQAKAMQVFRDRIQPLMAEHPFQARAPMPEMIGTIEILLDHLLYNRGEGALPTSLLVDRNGTVQVVYVGPVDVGDLLEDVGTFGLKPQDIGVRSNKPGRWFFRMPRPYARMIEALRQRKSVAEASFYATLERMQGGGRR